MKNSQLVYKVAYAMLNLIIVGILSLVFYSIIPLVVPTKKVKLPKGSVTNTIKSLQKQGYKLSIIDTYLLVAIGQPKSGELNIGKGQINRIDFLHKLTMATEPFNIITLIPGETREIFFRNIAKKYKLDYQKLEENYSKYSSSYPEAGILPDTYHISKGIKEEKLISFLVKSTEKRYKKLALQELKKYNKKEWLLYLTIASIIQKEAGNIEEMPKISSVIYNRLKKDMPLQMDGTLNYGKYSHVKVTPKRIKTDKSKFNTYANKGLPPYPICSVSIPAIKATLNPKKTDYLYFMRNKNGVHDFTDSYKEHLENIKRAKATTK